jgi:hypothetical protein
MQSLLQYRHAGVAAQAQLDHDAQKASGHSFQHRWTNGDTRLGTGGVMREATQSSLEAQSANGDLGLELSSAISQQRHANGDVQDSGSDDGGGDTLAPALTGINVNHRDGGQVFIVGWAGPDDPRMPRNWPLMRRVGVTIQIALIAMVLTAASAIDAAVLPQAAKDLNVSEVAESLATGKCAMVACQITNEANHYHQQ